MIIEKTIRNLASRMQLGVNLKQQGRQQLSSLKVAGGRADFNFQA
jgi:hypothetical protein